MDGTPFGRYRLQELIGEGGMGQVYKAFDTVTDRIVALKVLPDHSAGDRGYQERFRREAHAAAGLREPHVVPIHDYGEIDGRLFLDMRLIDGIDVKTLLAQRGPMPPTLSVSVIDQVAAALDAAHADGLVHRDVKPSNMLVTNRNFVYLIDFGIARAAGETGLTSTGAAIGTLAYMAPERFTTGQTDARSDVYALACVLHECLTGVQPFPGDSLEQQIAGHLTGRPPQPSLVGSAVPTGFDEVIARGLAKAPDDRYQTAGDLAAAAHHALHTGTSTPPAVTRSYTAATVVTDHPTQEDTVPRSAGSGTTRVDQNPTTSAIQPANGRTKHSNGKRNTVIFAAAVVVLAACAAGIGYAINTPRTAESAAENSSQTTLPAAGATPTQPAADSTQPTSAASNRASTSGVPDLGWPGPQHAGLAPSPEFPQSLPQWTLKTSWTLTTRAFQDSWSKAPGPGQSRFPATMNGCANQRFLVRWRAVNPNATVVATHLNAADKPTDQVTGNAGWMDLSGCYTPAFQFSASADRSTLTDVTIAVQQWVPAP
ncbi:protein kinase domain-containing protein [Rhodococcus koreensis]|uniref:protein kinase domain-containing protein n=1 Tax=Rhodococcus koreensis TaxID=99653 RepID=UPI0036DBC226